MRKLRDLGARDEKARGKPNQDKGPKKRRVNWAKAKAKRSEMIPWVRQTDQVWYPKLLVASQSQYLVASMELGI